MEQLLGNDSPTILVSLAENDPELAKAAVDAGADGLKVHTNVSHRASGNNFGTVADEEDVIREICKLDVPVGVVPGQDVETIRKAVPQLAELPVDYIDGYAHHIPPEMVTQTDLSTWLAPADYYTHDEILALRYIDVDAFELSIQPKERYGESLTTRDVARYVYLTSQLDRPVVIPSQLALTPEDAVTLVNYDITNFLLGAVVTNDTMDAIAETVTAFVDALDGI